MKKKETLVDMGDWCVVRFSEWKEAYDYTVLYAEHRHGCDKRVEQDYYLEWEWEDAPITTCYICNTPVPIDVMGLVVLANFDAVQRG